MSRSLSVRVAIALALTALVSVIAGILVALASITSHRIAEDLGEQLLSRAGDAVQREMAAYLGEAVRTSDLYARRIEHGLLPVTGLQAWERSMLDDLVASPDIASICFGNPAGDATWLLRHRGRLEVGRADGARDGFAQEFVVDPQTAIADTEHPIREYRYDPRVRPWYAAALGTDEPTWTPIYFWFGDSGGDLETGSGYTRVIRSPQTQEVQGVLVIDVTLGAISSFLQKLPLASQGCILVVDEHDLLVAASHGAVNTADGKRVAMKDHEHPAAQAAVLALSAAGGSQLTGRVTNQRFDIDGQPSRLRVTRFNPYPGIDWRIATIVPESAFLSHARSVQRRGIIVGVIASLGALAVGLLLARTISKPIISLRAHARRIGSGDFETPMTLRAPRELQELCEDLNHMASDLKVGEELRRSLALANEVQQSLLPLGSPTIKGLDIAGQSRYCETTGGDYFDFIEVATLPKDHALIAVGDVMGHGIASALLMATARAALRATAVAEGSLGVLLTRVNQVLARDARHGRFMTMALAVVDPDRGTLRWASAGHDEPIVYSPVRGEFRKLEGGDVPLGIAEGVQYEEYLLDSIEPGSIIVIGTDGIWEAPGQQRDRFGKERLQDVIREHASESAADISRALHRAMTAFSGKDRFPDDVTLVVIKVAYVK